MHYWYLLQSVGVDRKGAWLCMDGRCRWRWADGDGKQEMKRNARFLTIQFKMHLPDVSVLSFPIFRYMDEFQEVENPSEIRETVNVKESVLANVNKLDLSDLTEDVVMVTAVTMVTLRGHVTMVATGHDLVTLKVTTRRKNVTRTADR